MSGVLTIANAFTNAVTATGAQLDANFGSVTAYINDPTNRNNYAPDTGGTNTIALSFSPAVTGFTGGLELTFKAANTNTGGVILIANSAGTRTVVNADGSGLSAGQIQAGAVYKVIDDGTRAVMISAGAAPLPCGSMYVYSLGAGTSTITVAATDTFYQISSGVTAGTTYQVTFQNARELRCDVAGRYVVMLSAALECSSANQEVEAAIMLNGTANVSISAHTELASANKPMILASAGILTLAQNDLVSASVLNHTSTNNLTLDHLSVTMLYTQ